MSLNLRQVQEAIASELWFVATRQLVTRAPRPAMMAMKDLVDLYEKINDLSLREIVNKLEAHGSGGEPEWYGEAEMATGSAMAAAALRGTSASLDNRVRVPSFTVKLTGDELTWEGVGARGVDDPQLNPGQEALREPWGGGTTIVIERNAYGFSGWLESSSGGRIPISFGSHKPDTAREALELAKKFLRNVYGKSNPGGPKISSKLPVATISQRVASMSTAELMFAARELAKKTDQASDKACTAVLDELSARVQGPSFDSFVSEIYDNGTHADVHDNPAAALAVRCPICGAAPGSVCKVAGRVGSAATKYATHPGRVDAAELALWKGRRAAR